MTRSERTLWRRWVERRDGEAFAALVRRHARFVYDFARRVAGNSADAEDLTQEAYLKLAEAKPGEPDAVGLRAFLGRRVVLGARMLKRAALARRRHEAHAHHPGGAGGPEEIERREQAHRALDLLPAGERRAVELRFLHDLSYAEIAGVLGTTEEAARMRVHRGLERVKARLGSSACLAAVALFEPPARMLASTAKTALLTGGVVVAQATGKKAVILVGLALLLGLAATVVTHFAGDDREGRMPARAPITVRTEAAAAALPDEHAAPPEELPPEPPRIAGIVVDADGTPVPDATVRALRFAGSYAWVETSTDKDGRFRLDVEHGCTVQATHRAYATASVTADVGVDTRIVLGHGVPLRVEVRAGGTPVQDARVAATDNAMLLTDPLYRAPGEGATDASGVLELRVPEGKFEVWASATGWAPVLSPPVVCALGKPQVVVLDLVTGGVVEGTVRDSGGAAVSGARVVVQAHPGFRGAATTGADGSYVIEHVPLVSGPWLLVVADHPGHAPTSTSRMWNAADGERLRFDLTFPDPAQLSGVALDASGQPVPDRRVVVGYQGGLHLLYGYWWMSERWPFATTTDEHGRFELKGLPPGKTTVYLLPDSRNKFEVELVTGPNGPMEIRLAGVALRGRVLDADGNPVENARIEPGSALTDADGRFTLRERPKQIIVISDGYAAVALAVDGTDVEVRLPGTALTGTVVDPDGRGLSDITVTLEAWVGNTRYTTKSGTDDRGHFRFRGCSTGPYRLTAGAAGRDLIGGVRRLSGPEDDVVLVVASPDEAERRRVRGTVVDESGDPIDEPVSYQVVARKRILATGSAARRAGQPGSFVCEELEPRGEMTIVFNARGYLNSDPIAIVFDGRKPVEPLTITLRRGAEVEVSVTEEDGTPVPGASVHGYAANPIDGRTDAAGRCILEGVPPGRNRITVSHPYLTEVNEAYVDATAGARQRVEFRGKATGIIRVRLSAVPREKSSIVLRLADAHGTVVREDRVEPWLLQMMAQVNQRHYDLAITAPGTYRVVCEIDGVALPDAVAEARLRETIEVDLKPTR